ncbi:hypothetical protein [Poseidonocella sedimentorum]|uniref:Uncharacterized protein n=1 Tax=Poseidonocella sedimentorum TaxID=871652 RepID=A0A1I6D3R8_9RHOB|nr:hypothetical protein [Poseidonocella sedimentorum]SFR00109.1 hypothetical protein SAMN04515673_10290 [Poseidonocella sedimentorum]
MATFRALAALFFGAGLVLPAAAADFSDPTWPCIQRKVERLSPGLMWPAPLEEVTLAPEVESAVEDLVARLALRRTEVEDLQPIVSDFTRENGADPALLGEVFSRVFTRMARTRSAIIKGIEDYSLQQIALAEKIDAARTEMTALMQADAPDFDKVDALEEQVDWDERIFIDRQRSLTYVCETPVLLEKRLYAIAQLLQDAQG